MDGFSTIGALAVLLAALAFFSASEAAFAALNRHRLKDLDRIGSRGMRSAHLLTERFEHLNSTLLIGKYAVALWAAALATAALVPRFGGAGVGLATALITVLVIILCEIPARMLGRERPEQVAAAAAPILMALMTALTPLNGLIALWRGLIGKIIRPRSALGMTEEELITLVNEAQQEGGIDQHEHDLIRSAIEFNDVNVEDILTPRVDIVAVEDTDGMDKIERRFVESGFSRLPVYRESLDGIIGVIHEKDFYAHRHEGALDRMVNPVMYVPPTAKISAVLRMLQKSKMHIAVIADEYGGTVGIVTLEDIIEELVGEIYDEHDKVIEFVEQLPDGRLKIAGSAELKYIEPLLKVGDEVESTTVGGWVTEQLGRIPESGEQFKFAGHNVTVTAVDGKKALEIVIDALPGMEDGLQSGGAIK